MMSDELSFFRRLVPSDKIGSLRPPALAALIGLLFVGCVGEGPLDDCGCKLDGVEVQRCVSELFCSGFSNSSAENEAEVCCGVSGAMFQSVGDITNGDGDKVGCTVNFDTPQGRLFVGCSDDFMNY